MYLFVLEVALLGTVVDGVLLVVHEIDVLFLQLGFAMAMFQTRSLARPLEQREMLQVAEFVFHYWTTVEVWGEKGARLLPTRNVARISGSLRLATGCAVSLLCGRHFGRRRARCDSAMRERVY